MTSLGALSQKQYNDLLGINEVYRQQKAMYEERKHSISGRIVSISEPHVRPIERLKATAPIEFGAKLSVSRVDGYVFLETLEWKPYHEGKKLQKHVESYKRLFGWYPASVHADKIYRTKENLQYCREKRVQLAGPPLGRLPKDKEVYKAILKEARKDEIERIPIEGAFGTAKRKYRMGQIS